jgi:putative N-acetylmannosamine-6-phosphate epimerase/predicted NBD/HSP70 family sugar kinase
MNLFECPLIVSAQASPGAAVDHPETLWQLAKCSLDQGVKVLRLQGLDNIAYIKERTPTPVIGLVKEDYNDSDVYITPTRKEVSALLELRCEIVALDATTRRRPGGEQLQDLVSLIHSNGVLAMGDCDSTESVNYAIECGCDFVGTTLSGYTDARCLTSGPDFELVRYAVSKGKPVIAEGRYSERWEVEAALNIGASAVVIGGAINDPVKQTNRFLVRTKLHEKVGAVDIGGTWIRFAVFENESISTLVKEPLPQDRDDRMEWIRAQIRKFGVDRLGVGTGGTVDPHTGEVWEAKPIIPGHQGSVFSSETFGIPTKALNDGLATAFGHACHPDFAGKDVATLALGTGVGAGFIRRGEIQCGQRGEYPRLNDVLVGNGETVEDWLGGAALSPNPTESQKEKAVEAVRVVVRLVREMIYPDAVVVAGSVGLSDWLLPVLKELDCTPSPYGHDAGLFGSYWLARSV